MFQKLGQLGALATDKMKFHALQAAILFNRVGILEIYSKNYDDLLKLRLKEDSLLHVAARTGSAACLEFLLSQANADDYNLTNQVDFTPADEAYTHDHQDCFKILTAKSAKHGENEKLEKPKQERAQEQKAMLVAFEQIAKLPLLPVDHQTPFCGESDKQFDRRLTKVLK